MALTFSGSDAALLNRFAAFVKIVRDLVALKGGTATTNVLAPASLATRGTTLETMMTSAPALSAELDGHWQALDAIRSGISGGASQIRALAEKAFIAHVVGDTPLLTRDLTSALGEVKRQMLAQGKTLNAAEVTISAQADLGTPTGDPAFVVTCLRPDGLTQQYPRSETLRLRVTTDQYSGGATARRETGVVTGEAAVTSDPFDHRYPSGSGASTQVSFIDSAQDASSGSTTGNLLANADFETASSNTFPGWVYDTGTAGTNLLANGSGYSGDNALKITSSSDATVLQVSQTFGTALGSTGNAGGTPSSLRAATVYAVNLWAKAITAAPAAGLLRVALLDGSNNPVYGDQGAQALYQEDDTALLLEDDTALYQEDGAVGFTVDLTELTTSFAPCNGALVTPTVLPATYKLALSTITPISNGSSVVLDDIAMTPMTLLYTGGPYVAAFSGADDVVAGDTYTRTLTCTRGVLADWLERFFTLEAKGVVLPYTDEDPSEADTLLTA